jgi:hypothetical protein
VSDEESGLLIKGPGPAGKGAGKGASRDKKKGGVTRRLVMAGAAAAIVGGGAFAANRTGPGRTLWRKARVKLAGVTELDSFASTPPLVPHDPAKDRVTIQVAQGGGPAGNIDSVLDKLGGIAKFIGPDDVVAIKVSAQWWNQGMTNVAAVKRTIEQILAIPGWKGDVVVFENTHFRFPDKAVDDPTRGLTRAWTHPSARNVDVPGWNHLGDLASHFKGLGAPVSFVGLVDAGGSSLANDPWYDPEHKHGFYGGDGRGPLVAGDTRDGMFWDFAQTFRLKRSWVDFAQTPLTWPRFTCPRTGLVIDFRDGVFRRENNALVPAGRSLRFVNMTTGNEHGSTGFTGACKSPMGIVDMSAGALGTHPLVADYQSIHYFGAFGRGRPSWRMAGPLAFFGQRVRKPDLYLTVVEWMAVTPKSDYDETTDDIRHSEKCAVKAGTIVAGTDPVAIDMWCVRNLLMKQGGKYAAMYNLDDPDAKVTKFLRYFRQVSGSGTLDPALVTVA